MGLGSVAYTPYGTALVRLTRQARVGSQSVAATIDAESHN
jgi:hypothetical protein